jgi:ABC-type transport system involved in cytochrome bd biosynthesis fused ATPase/permease subunit
MPQKRDDDHIMQNFRLRKSRQFIAIAAAMLLIILLALLFNRPCPFGQLSKNTAMAAQLIVIAVFIVFSSANWRCPSCKKYLGADLNRQVCGKCGARLR